MYLKKLYIQFYLYIQIYFFTLYVKYKNHLFTYTNIKEYLFFFIYFWKCYTAGMQEVIHVTVLHYYA